MEAMLQNSPITNLLYWVGMVYVSDCKMCYEGSERATIKGPTLMWKGLPLPQQRGALALLSQKGCRCMAEANYDIINHINRNYAQETIISC